MFYSMIQTNEGKIESYLVVVVRYKYYIPHSPIPYKQWFPYLRDWMMREGVELSRTTQGYYLLEVILSQGQFCIVWKMEIKFTLKFNDDFLKEWLIIIFGLN